MSTPCRIGRRYQGGGIISISTSNDGYLSWTGRILYEHYPPTAEGVKKVEELLSLGNLYFLQKNIGVPHDGGDYDFFKKNEQCFSYNRDFTYSVNNLPLDSLDLAELIEWDGVAAFYYIFDSMHGWGWFYGSKGPSTIKALEPTDWKKKEDLWI
jgi:hypothetical protein